MLFLAKVQVLLAPDAHVVLVAAAQRKHLHRLGHTGAPLAQFHCGKVRITLLHLLHGNRVQSIGRRRCGSRVLMMVAVVLPLTAVSQMMLAMPVIVSPCRRRRFGGVRSIWGQLEQEQAHEEYARDASLRVKSNTLLSSFTLSKVITCIGGTALSECGHIFEHSPFRFVVGHQPEDTQLCR